MTTLSNPLRDSLDRRLPRIAGPCVLVILGVNGDLSCKKLMPAIYDLANRGLLPPGFGLVGFARRNWADEDFAKVAHDAIRKYSRTQFREEVWQQLLQGIRFIPGDFADDKAFENLKNTLTDLDQSRGTGGNHAFYLAIPPKVFELVLNQLKKHDMGQEKAGSWNRVVIEKPFGHDLSSAIELERVISALFPPQSVFRIDHYLGKETVQNVLAIRFANQLFEPIWNNHYVSHVQITMAEDIGIAGRAGYFDGIGVARDVIQNHLFQLMCLTAMEEPTSFENSQLKSEKEKVLAAASVPKDYAAHTARGQYAAGWEGGTPVIGYLDEAGVPANSTTETYAAIRVDIDNRRWAGVPFYLRSAKRMPRRVSEVALLFKRAPYLPFNPISTEELSANTIVLRIQPDEGMTTRIGAKVPGSQFELRDVFMDFNYGGSFTEESPEAYERLILDVLLGEPPLFPQQEEVELSWKILDPVLDYWAESNGTLEQYTSGTWGPTSGDKLLARDGFTWRRP